MIPTNQSQSAPTITTAQGIWLASMALVSVRAAQFSVDHTHTVKLKITPPGANVTRGTENQVEDAFRVSVQSQISLHVFIVSSSVLLLMIIELLFSSM